MMFVCECECMWPCNTDRCAGSSTTERILLALGPLPSASGQHSWTRLLAFSRLVLI